MNRLWLIVLLFVCLPCFSQETKCADDTTRAIYEGKLHENILTIRWGGIQMYDQYLSPLPYKGQFIAVKNEWWQGFDEQSKSYLGNGVIDWMHVGKVLIQGARTYNPAYTNIIYSVGTNAGWGVHYDFKRLIGVEGLSVYVGPYLDLDLFVKDHLNNVNKPVSVDLSLNIKAHAGVGYSFRAKKTSYRMRYTAMTDLIGVQFVPEYGESYYEITEGIIGGSIGLGSLHNRLSIRQELTLDMQFKHSAWRIGVEHEYLKHEMNGLQFQREQVSLVIGTIFNYKTSIKRF